MHTEIERLRIVESQRTQLSVWKRTRRYSRDFPVVPIVIIVLLAITAIFAPLLAPHDPEFGVLLERNVPPPWLDGGSSDHLLGTDNLGRDLFSRVIFGSRISLSGVGTHTRMA